MIKNIPSSFSLHLQFNKFIFSNFNITLNYITFPVFRPLYFKHTVIAIILNYISNKSQNIDLEPQISTARYVFARPGGEINSFTDVLGLNR